MDSDVGDNGGDQPIGDTFGGTDVDAMAGALAQSIAVQAPPAVVQAPPAVVQAPTSVVPVVVPAVVPAPRVVQTAGDTFMLTLPRTSVFRLVAFSMWLARTGEMLDYVVDEPWVRELDSVNWLREPSAYIVVVLARWLQFYSTHQVPDAAEIVHNLVIPSLEKYRKTSRRCDADIEWPWLRAGAGPAPIDDGRSLDAGGERRALDILEASVGTMAPGTVSTSEDAILFLPSEEQPSSQLLTTVLMNKRTAAAAGRHRISTTTPFWQLTQVEVPVPLFDITLSNNRRGDTRSVALSKVTSRAAETFFTMSVGYALPYLPVDLDVRAAWFRLVCASFHEDCSGATLKSGIIEPQSTTASTARIEQLLLENARMQVLIDTFQQQTAAAQPSTLQEQRQQQSDMNEAAERQQQLEKRNRVLVVLNRVVNAIEEFRQNSRSVQRQIVQTLLDDLVATCDAVGPEFGGVCDSLTRSLMQLLLDVERRDIVVVTADDGVDETVTADVDAVSSAIVAVVDIIAPPPPPPNNVVMPPKPLPVPPPLQDAFRSSSSPSPLLPPMWTQKSQSPVVILPSPSMSPSSPPPSRPPPFLPSPPVQDAVGSPPSRTPPRFTATQRLSPSPSPVAAPLPNNVQDAETLARESLARDNARNAMQQSNSGIVWAPTPQTSPQRITEELKRLKQQRANNTAIINDIRQDDLDDRARNRRQRQADQRGTAP